MYMYVYNQMLRRLSRDMSNRNKRNDIRCTFTAQKRTRTKRW